MANEVINPFQTYRDDKGQPLAGGSLRILQAGTQALGTAFSDSALSVPQTVDGYPLDDFGRVTGDLKWSGVRDVEVYDRNSEFIRRDNNSVTAVDASVFAINEETVADMVANTNLVLGDVVETQNYLAATQLGGARYLVVGGGTGTDDGYLFHDLDNGLQAQLLDQEENNNFYVAGAVGDGVADDGVPVQAVLDVGGDIEVANGTFACSGRTLTSNARLYGNGTLLRLAFTSSAIITITGNDLVVTFDGVVLDGNLANQAADLTVPIIDSQVLSSAATAIALVTFNNVQFQNASQYDVLADGDDMGFPILYTFAQCNFIGGEEQGSNLCASIKATDGVNLSVDDCYFNLTTAPGNGRAAVVTDSNDDGTTALTNPGTLSVTASTMQFMGANGVARAAVHARQAREVIVDGNRFLTCQNGGVLVGSECQTVTVVDNLIDGLTDGGNAFGAIAMATQAIAGPGDNWQIDNNEIINPAMVGVNLDGSTSAADVSRVQVSDNIIDSPLLQAILFHNVNGLAIQDNQINMDNEAGVNAVEENTDGVAGLISVEGNEIQNVDGWAIDLNQSSSAAIVTVDGNTIDAANDGYRVTDKQGAFISNNVTTAIVNQIGLVTGPMGDCYVDGNMDDGQAPVFFASSGTITDLLLGENFWPRNGSTIRSIAVTGVNQTVGPVEAHFHEFAVTGVSSIDTLQDPGVDGYVVVLQSDGAANLTFNDGLGNMNLGANRTLGDATDTLTLMWNQLNSVWNQVAFSDN